MVNQGQEPGRGVGWGWELAHLGRPGARAQLHTFWFCVDLGTIGA
jgi:hypothetical protein